MSEHKFIIIYPCSRFQTNRQSIPHGNHSRIKVEKSSGEDKTRLETEGKTELEWDDHNADGYTTLLPSRTMIGFLHTKNPSRDFNCRVPCPSRTLIQSPNLYIWRVRYWPATTSQRYLSRTTLTTQHSRSYAAYQGVSNYAAK